MKNLESEIDLCPFLIICDPCYEEMMDYCALNYAACERYEKEMRKKKELRKD